MNDWFGMYTYQLIYVIIKYYSNVKYKIIYLEIETGWGYALPTWPTGIINCNYCRYSSSTIYFMAILKVKGKKNQKRAGKWMSLCCTVDYK